MCGFCNVWVCARARVCVCVCVCVCAGFVIRGCFGNMCTCTYRIVLFCLCIFILICYYCKDYCHQEKTQLQ